MKKYIVIVSENNERRMSAFKTLHGDAVTECTRATYGYGFSKKRLDGIRGQVIAPDNSMVFDCELQQHKTAPYFRPVVVVIYDERKIKSPPEYTDD